MVSIYLVGSVQSSRSALLKSSRGSFAHTSLVFLLPPQLARRSLQRHSNDPSPSQLHPRHGRKYHHLERKLGSQGLASVRILPREFFV